MSKKYGNDHAWFFYEDDCDPCQPLEVWHSLNEGDEEVMAHATDKYNATKIVDALITAEKVASNPEKRLSKHETVFLQFIAANCPEPWATMADNAIMWSDREAYNTLKTKFSEIY